jgi:hypothetical protein
MAKIQKYICTNCKHVGKSKKVKRGSRKTEIFWWMVFSPIAILYSLYRFTGSKKCCEECGSFDIYPTKSDLLEVMSHQNSNNEINN